MANRKRKTMLELCRHLLGQESITEPESESGETPSEPCPICRGPMRLVKRLTAVQLAALESKEVPIQDSA